MLVNAVTYTFPNERADDVERLLRELGEASRAEAGCGGFDVCRGDAENPGTFVLFEKWRDQAALDAHYATEHFVRLGANGIRPLATSRHAFKGTLVE
jgi:quinol monooxygenase YgiN